MWPSAPSGGRSSPHTHPQHLLLDRAETRTLEDARLPAADTDGADLPADLAPAPSEDLLLACLPALCLRKPADLPNPRVTARRTLHFITNRVHNNPGLATLAAD
ncbi:hypothetical protein DEJ44_28930 [Streptomyces venezuelae]|uniref:hypothetical protein n=1 Tax=Streptomyces venezuelae TaxID=54571 RepID=UPI001239E224|nr:hypothetical protein [Streptomyces venezuelae]QES09256.1 hypothetical protein DEJ44_28930 [Streptomyces venezuelae]